MTPVAQVSMLIRRPAEEVFDAFLEPKTLTRFWLSRSSARLEPGKSATWEFMVPGAVAEVRVRAMSRPHSLVLDFAENETAEFAFEERPDGTTRIEIRSEAKGANAQEAVDAAIEATQGYTLVVANLKALLETGKSAGLVEDKAILIAEKQQAAKGR